MSLDLKVLHTDFSVCQFKHDEPVPAWAEGGEFLAITRTAAELSIVVDTGLVPSSVHAEHGWRAFKVGGPLDFSLIGILASLATTLAEAEISIFAISTFNTDYLLVKAEKLDRAVDALRSAGHKVLVQ